MLPIIREWGTCIPQDVLDMGLHDAVVWEEPLDDIRCLIDAGADVNAILETTYFSPLMIASRKGRADIITLLLDSGARKDLVVDGHTALSLATDLEMRSLLV
jgi:ankyrin repeat protein